MNPGPLAPRLRRRLTMREAFDEVEILSDRKPEEVLARQEHLRVWRWRGPADGAEVTLTVSYDIIDRVPGVVRPRITLSGCVTSEIEQAHKAVEVLSIAAALGMNIRTYLSTIDVPLELVQ